MTGELIDSILFGSYFELKLSADVFWIPYNMGIPSNYSIEAMRKLISSSPEIKKSKINTFADAVTLFVLSNFKETSDNIVINENDIFWEHHKPGRIAVQCNEGCCASCASWLNYLLCDNFEDFGYLSLIRSMGGHIINYFFHNNWYYILDLQPFIDKYRSTICVQSGKRSDFVKTKFITAVLVKTKTLNAYINFHNRYTSNIIPEHLYIQYHGNLVQPIGYNLTKKARHLYIPKTSEISILDTTKPLNEISYEFVKYPEIIPNFFDYVS